MWEVLYIQITCPSATPALPNTPFRRKRASDIEFRLYSQGMRQVNFAFVPQLSELDDGGRCRRFESVEGTPRGRGNVTSLQAHLPVASLKLWGTIIKLARLYLGRIGSAQAGRASDTPKAFLEVL